MMIKPLAMCAALCVALAGQASAEGRKVVVELYTSQGCSSCPPADALLQELAKRPDVIALALHVDYWDYIGWKDIFANPAFTKRQKGYAHAAGARSIYTPQMVVGGRDHIVGARPMEAMDHIQKHKDLPQSIALQARALKGTLQIEAQAVGKTPAAMVLQLVRYAPGEDVKITRGENAGRTLRYVNVVTSWERVGEWNGKQPLSLTLPFKGSAPGVVIVQTDGMGPILAAVEVK